MRSCPDRGYKYILVHQCHATKLCVLRPLVDKSVMSVSVVLMEIWALMGAPAV